MANKKITDLQQVSSITESLNFPCDDTLQTYRATVGQLKTYLAPIYVPNIVRRFTSGSGTMYQTRAFICSSASCTVGATYTNNSITWTVVRTSASQNIVYMHGNGNPTSSGTLTKASGTGDATITFSSVRTPISQKVLMTGGGGGGGGGGAGSNGVDGTDTTFASVLTAGKGFKGNANGGSVGAGGTNTVSSNNGFQTKINVAGGSGQYAGYATSAISTASGLGGVSYFGGAADFNNSPAANSGCGGGGGANNGLASGTSAYAGCGGGAGGTIEVEMSDSALTGSYAYSVGVGGSGGSGAGSGLYNGRAGADGIIIVEERFN